LSRGAVAGGAPPARQDGRVTTICGAVEQWVAARVDTGVVHLDTAACGLVSRAALRAEVEHLTAEAASGGYVAEEAAEPVLAAGRAALAGLVGLAGADVAFSDGAGTSFAVLLAAWPLPRGARVGTVDSEYGGNARVLRALAAERGWDLVPLPVDADGRITGVPRDLDLVTFPQVASQRGVAQPVEQVLVRGVPLLLDVAQSAGQVEVPAGCAAYVGTSRKWLCGPRGVGFAAVDPSWQRRLAEPPTLQALVQRGVRRWESAEAHVAGRVGLAVAAQEWTPALLPVVHERARAARTALAGVSGWRVVESADEPTGITTLEPTDGADPFATRAGLLHGGLLVSAVPASRAAELAGPVLRVSAPAWVTDGDLDALAAALHRRTVG
jgi:pyridoxal 5-phosphate dependent beta-lyase